MRDLELLAITQLGSPSMYQLLERVQDYHTAVTDTGHASDPLGHGVIFLTLTVMRLFVNQ